MRLVTKIIFLCCIAIFLSGCIIGRTYNFADVQADFTASGSKRVGIATQDRRPYVLSGDKDPEVVGLLRHLYRIPFNVKTESGKPFAEDVTQIVSSALKKKGFSPVTVFVSPDEPNLKVLEKLLATKGDVLMLITIKEWKSDTYMKSGVYYDLNLRVFNSAGELIAENSVRGANNLGGGLSRVSYSKSAVPASFKAKIEQLFNDPKIVKALMN